VTIRAICGRSWAISTVVDQRAVSEDFNVTALGSTRLALDPLCAPSSVNQTLGFDATESSLTLYYYLQDDSEPPYRIEQYVRQ
jgi:hypothetical protein